MIRFSPRALRLLLLAFLGLVLLVMLARRPAGSGNAGDGSNDPPCFASKLGFPCR